MKPSKIVLSVAAGLSLAACTPSEPATPLTRGARSEADDELLMYQDIHNVQEAERGKSIFQTVGTDSISFSRDGKEYRFANAKAYRAFVNHRLDSMVARGFVIQFDTTVHPRTTVTSTLHTLPNPT